MKVPFIRFLFRRRFFAFLTSNGVTGGICHCKSFPTAIEAVLAVANICNGPIGLIRSWDNFLINLHRFKWPYWELEQETLLSFDIDGVLGNSENFYVKSIVHLPCLLLKIHVQ